MTDKNVHTEHCCKLHGCKYGDKDCPVVLDIQKQSYLCERCEEDLVDAQGLTEYYFSLLSDEERSNIMNQYCKICGSKDIGCQCWDE